MATPGKMTLRKLRENGRWDLAVKGALGQRALLAENFQERLRRHLLGPRCLLLDYAASAQSRGELSTCLRQLEKYPATGQRDCALGSVSAAYAARKNLIHALVEQEVEAPSLRMAIEQMIEVTRESWRYVPNSAAQKLACQQISLAPAAANGIRPEPSFMNWLPNDGMREIFRELAKTHGWLNPGLLLSGETLTAIYGDRRTVAATVRTWVLFAWNDDRRPHGVVARLTMEQLPNGCGVLLPDAWSAGYLQMDQDFSDGLQHAWYAVQQQRCTIPCDFDWRWKLELYPAIKDLLGIPFVVPITGRSAEGAIACAMLAVDRRNPKISAEGEPLDLHVAMTAQFRDPGTESVVLDQVGSVDIKLLSRKFEQRQIQHVIVASNQEADVSLPLVERVEFHKVDTLSDAYHLLTRWPRITRYVKKSMHKAATKLRHDLCGKEVKDWQLLGRRYVPSPLEQVVMTPKRMSRPKEGGPSSIPLSAKECQAFRYGRWSPLARRRADISTTPRAPRIRLFADSGLGKSVQLMICEQKIAGDRSQRIPVRIGKTDASSINLSAIKWEENVEQVRNSLLSDLVMNHVHPNHRGEAQAWFADQVRNGQVVFIFDAIDQSSGFLNGLGKFLNSAEISGCTAILAGRPETRFSRGEAWEGLSEEEWCTVRVLPFGHQQQRLFLGRSLDRMLTPGAYDCAKERCHHWEDLLGVPLLLSFLKQLADESAPLSTGKRLQEFQNRYEIYRETVSLLMTKGIKTVPGSPQSLKTRANRLLAEIAFETVRRNDFTAVVEGDAYQSACDRLGDLHDTMLQVDLITEHGVLDSFGPNGLEFRHRSMLEYFAGCQLASMFQGESSRREAIEVLRDVHSVLDQHGQFRNDLLNADGTCQNLPTDWQWTLRFALGHAKQGTDRDTLAWRLIRLGNPWVVFQAINSDKLKFDTDLDRICRWLVHSHGWHCRRENSDPVQKSCPYDGVWDARKGPPVAAWAALTEKPSLMRELESTLTITDWLIELLSPSTREAVFLKPLLELLEATIAAAREDVSLAGVAEACAVALSKYRREAHTPRPLPTGTVIPTDTERGFIPIPAGAFDARLYPNYPEFKLAENSWPVEIAAGVKLADFPVTNAEIELWCPTLKRYRKRYGMIDKSDGLEQLPAVHITWHMAKEFSRWLTGSRADGAYSLPTEWEWEYAGRSGTPKNRRWVYGDCTEHFHEGLIPWHRRSRAEALAAHSQAALLHPSRDWAAAAGITDSLGLLDLLGNVGEWCDVETNSDGAPVTERRVMRGGWFDFERDDGIDGIGPVEFCYWALPDTWHNTVGFRLCWRGSASAPESSSPDL